MKISSLSASGTASMADSRAVHESAFARLRHLLGSLFLKLDQIGTAIALGEAGDLDGAKALREQNLKVGSTSGGERVNRHGRAQMRDERRVY